MKFKNLILSIILMLSVLLIPTVLAEAVDKNVKLPLEVDTFTITSLDESGSMLQKTKE